MRNILERGAFIASAFLLFYTSPSVAQLSLEQAYRASLEKNEAPLGQEQRQIQSEEREQQAKGAFFPSISLLGNYQRQDQENFNGRSSRNLRLNAQQPLFKGTREYANWASLSASAQAERHRTDAVKLTLYSTVAATYFEVLSAQADLHNLEHLLELTDLRVKETQERSKVGRSRQADVLSAQSQSASLQAQIDAAQARVDQAWEAFALATGITERRRLTPASFVPEAPPALQSCLDKLAQRPDLLTQKNVVESSEAGVRSARAGHFPSLDLNGNYYLERTGGALASSKWDVGLQLSFPLFQGGIVNSQVREASSKLAEQRIEMSRIERTAANQIKTLHAAASGAFKQFQSLEKALEIAKKNYEIQNKDYRLSLATNLDVLQALNSYQETQRSLDRVRYQSLMSLAQLHAAVGDLHESF